MGTWGSSLPTAIVELQSVRKPNSLVQQNSPTTPHHTTHQPNMAPKAPSEGQKVDLGQNAPIKNEPAGSVPSGSLAAESSAFSSNVGIHGENQPSGNVATTLGSGNNTTEGFDDAGTRDGLKAALAAEPGSKDDPSRRAELQFQETNEQRTTAAQPKDGGVSNQTKYDALNRETSS